MNTFPAPERQFLYRLQAGRADFRKTGPNKEEIPVLQEHYDRLKEFTKKGIVILAGLTMKTDGNAFGIVIFRADSEDTAHDFMNGDPAVKKGVFIATLFPFQVALVQGQTAD